MILEKDENWYSKRQLVLDERARERLRELENYLGNSKWLDDQFSAGDLLMVTVLRRLESANSPDGPQLLDEFPSLAAYVARGKERPAFKRAFDAQKAVFEVTKSKKN
jgi:glutathione S-transferase